MALNTPIRDYSALLETNTLRLTFDDGPKQNQRNSNKGPNSLRIAQFLSEHNISATFFVTGQNVERDPDLVRNIHLLDHVIGNHSFSHSNLTKLTPSELHYEVQRTFDAIRGTDYVGEIPFRPPYGLWNERCAYAMSLVPELSNKHSGVFGWNIGSKYPDWLAWKRRYPVSLQFQLLKKEISIANNRGVVLLHDLSANDELNSSLNLTYPLVRKLVKWASDSKIVFEAKCDWKVS